MNIVPVDGRARPEAVIKVDCRSEILAVVSRPFFRNRLRSRATYKSQDYNQ